MLTQTFDLPLGLRLWPVELSASPVLPGEGFSFSLLENTTDSYRFTIVAGANRVGDIFRASQRLLPEEAFLILEFYDQECETENLGENEAQPAPTVYYSPYLPTGELLDFLIPYLPRLIHDGFVGFGLANNREGFELFYSEEKVLSCFTGNHIRLMDLLSRLGLDYVPEMAFPTDFGHDHLSLLCHPRKSLPEPFASMSDSELDYVHFCGELTEQLEMYPVEDGLSFFLSKREQDLIEQRLLQHEDFAEFAEDDFGSLLLDWSDFVSECENSFQGDLWEYRQGLRLRDMLQYVIEGMPDEFGHKLLEILTDADSRFKQTLIDRRKRLDPAAVVPLHGELFWYHGVVRNQGVELRRDLIRHGWFQP